MKMKMSAARAELPHDWKIAVVAQLEAFAWLHTEWGKGGCEKGVSRARKR